MESEPVRQAYNFNQNYLSFNPNNIENKHASNHQNYEYIIERDGAKF